MRFLKRLLRWSPWANGSGSVAARRKTSQTPTCDRCGKAVHFDGPESGTVSATFSTPPMTRTLCAVCAHEEETERRWRESGIWIGDDIPQSLRSMRPVTPEELRKLLRKDD